MVLLEVIVWWYTTAWLHTATGISRRISSTLAFFSVGLLLRTLFDPFRQIAAGSVRGSLNDEARAFADRTFSRFVGAFVRTFVIILGLIGAFAVGVFGVVQLIVWPVVPLLPLLGVYAAVSGWVIG